MNREERDKANTVSHQIFRVFVDAYGISDVHSGDLTDSEVTLNDLIHHLLTNPVAGVTSKAVGTIASQLSAEFSPGKFLVDFWPKHGRMGCEYEVYAMNLASAIEMAVSDYRHRFSIDDQIEIEPSMEGCGSHLPKDFSVRIISAREYGPGAERNDENH